jgi:hypothetical protein
MGQARCLRTYFQPTAFSHTVQNMSATTCIPVMRERCSRFPSVTFTLRNRSRVGSTWNRTGREREREWQSAPVSKWRGVEKRRRRTKRTPHSWSRAKDEEYGTLHGERSECGRRVAGKEGRTRYGRDRHGHAVLEIAAREHRE